MKILYLILSSFFLFPINADAQTGVARIQISLNNTWKFHEINKTEWLPATVPGPPDRTVRRRHLPRGSVRRHLLQPREGDQCRRGSRGLRDPAAALLLRRPVRGRPARPVEPAADPRRHQRRPGGARRGAGAEPERNGSHQPHDDGAGTGGRLPQPVRALRAVRLVAACRAVPAAGVGQRLHHHPGHRRRGARRFRQPRLA